MRVGWQGLAEAGCKVGADERDGLEVIQHAVNGEGDFGVRGSVAQAQPGAPARHPGFAEDELRFAGGRQGELQQDFAGAAALRSDRRGWRERFRAQRECGVAEPGEGPSRQLVDAQGVV